MESMRTTQQRTAAYALMRNTLAARRSVRLGSLIALLAIACVLVSEASCLPDPTNNWTVTWGYPSYLTATAVAVGASADVFVTGTFYLGPIDFDPGAGVAELGSPQHPSFDAYVTKFSSDGEFQWARVWGGEYTYCYGYDVLASPDGDVYVVGDFSGSVDLDPGATEDVRSAEHSYDVYLMKLSADGDLRWVHTMPGFEIPRLVDTFSRKQHALCCDGDGNVYVAGRFLSKADSIYGYEGITEYGSERGMNSVVAKFNSAGTQEWSFHTPVRVSDIEVGKSQWLYIIGTFDGEKDLDPGPGVDIYSGETYSNGCLACMDLDGDHQWAMSWAESAEVIPRAIGLDPAGGVYIGGTFSESADLDPGSGVALAESRGDTDVFLIGLSPDGEFRWLRALGGIGDDVVNDVEVHADLVWLTGSYRGCIEFLGSERGSVLRSQGDDDVFLACFTTEGESRGAWTWGGNDEDAGQNVAVDDSGNVYLTGEFVRMLRLQSGMPELRSNVDTPNAFLTKVPSMAAE